MSKELNFETDNTIDVANLPKEFRELPPIFFGYAEVEAEAEENYGIKKAEHEELRSFKYLEFRQKEGKVTEATLEAMIDTDADVKKALRDMLSAKRDFETLKGYLESLRVKKDNLIQLGANARKEM